MWFPRGYFSVFWRSVVLFKCCCTRLGVYHWYVLKGGAILREHEFRSFYCPKRAPAHHVEVYVSTFPAFLDGFGGVWCLFLLRV